MRENRRPGNIEPGAVKLYSLTPLPLLLLGRDKEENKEELMQDRAIIFVKSFTTTHVWVSLVNLR